MPATKNDLSTAPRPGLTPGPTSTTIQKNVTTTSVVDALRTKREADMLDKVVVSLGREVRMLQSAMAKLESIAKDKRIKYNEIVVNTDTLQEAI